MLKNVRIVMTGPGFGEFFIDGEQIKGVVAARVELGVNQPNRVALTLLAKTVEFEGLADISTFASAAQDVAKLERGEVPAEREAIRLLGEAARLELKPDDTLVLSCPGPIDHAAGERLCAELSSRMNGRRVLILCGGMKLGVLGD
jgi:hypothetical protein